MPKLLPEDIEKFVKCWVLANVHYVPGLAKLECEIDRLSAELTGDARENGISGRDVHKTLGDIDDYLTREYEKMRDPEAGFCDAGPKHFAV